MLAKLLAHQLRHPAGILGRMVARVMESTNKEAYRDVLGALDWKRAKHLFEIGYGTGDGLTLIRESAPSCRLSGIDFSALMHERASARLNAGGRTAELVCGDFLSASLASGAYSHVLCVNVVYFWAQLAEPLQKVAAMIEPGGTFVLFMRDEAYLEKKKLLDSGVFHRYAPAAVEQALREAGFAVTQTRSEAGVTFRAEKPASSQSPSQA